MHGVPVTVCVVATVGGSSRSPTSWGSIRRRRGPIVRETATFPGRVYLFNADSYKSVEDQPLSAESKWPTFYGASPENLTRGTFDGSANKASYLKVLIRPTATPATS